MANRRKSAHKSINSRADALNGHHALAKCSREETAKGVTNWVVAGCTEAEPMGAPYPMAAVRPVAGKGGMGGAKAVAAVVGTGRAYKKVSSDGNRVVARLVEAEEGAGAVPGGTRPGVSRRKGTRHTTEPCVGPLPRAAVEEARPASRGGGGVETEELKGINDSRSGARGVWVRSCW